MHKLGVFFTVTVFCAAIQTQAARPVARWDVVPDQRFSETFEAGVCAFHLDGVKVEFSVNGTAVKTIENPTRNPRTGVWEYWLPLKAADYPDGPLDLTAKAVSLGEVPESFDLPSLRLYANAGGSLTVDVTIWVDAAAGLDTNPGTEAAPLRSLAAAVKKTPAGGTINLQAGTYASASLGGGAKRDYWTTIQAAPGVERDEVNIASGRPSTQRLRWHNLSLFCDVGSGNYTTILAGENGSQQVWLDGCRAYNKQGRWGADSTTFGNRYVAFVTGGVTTEMCNGPGASLIRDHRIEKITSDAFTGSDKLVVNSVCRDIDAGSTGAHPDFHQSYSPEPNWVQDVILYNVSGTECISQGLFGSRLRDSAFVNVMFEKGDTVMYSQYSGPMENVLFLHLTIVRQSWLWRDSYSPADVHVINGVFQNMTGYVGDGSAGLWIADNHFVDPSRAPGANATTGDPHFANVTTHDFHLLKPSPAIGSGRTLQCVPADINGVPHPATGRNRGAYATPPSATTISLSGLK